MRCLWMLLLPLVSAVRAQTAADFFDDRSVHDIWLEVSARDWAALQTHYLENTYYPAQFTWNSITMNIGIRSRGSGSRSPIKPNLLLKFDKYVKKQMFLGESAIVAKANNQDPSNLRENISFKLFRKMGLPAPRESFARIHLSGDYLGFFVMVEYVDEQFLSRDFGENSGYLYEWQNPEVYNFNYLGSDPNTYAKFLDLKTGQSQPDLVNFLRLVEAVNLTSDADFISAVSKYLDPKIYLTQVATEMVLAESDGIVGGTFGMNNLYLYQFAGQTLYQFLPWDKDNTFDYSGWSIKSGLSDNVLSRRLLAIAEFNNTYMSALAKAADLFGGSGGWADLELNRAYDLIAAAARSDPNKQCTVSNVVQPCGAQEFENAVDYLHSFIAKRKAFVNDSVRGYFRNPDDPNLAAATVFGSSASTLSPGAVVNISATGLGPLASLRTTANWPRTLGDVWVAVDGVRAPLLSVSGATIQIQVPWGIRPGSANIAVAVRGALSNTLEVSVAASSPAILALVHADGSIVSTANPARRAETLSAYAVGLGEVSPEISIGATTPDNSLFWINGAAHIWIGGLPSGFQFAGLTPGFVGLYQLDFTVPGNCSLGASVPVTIDLGDQPALSALAIQ